MSTSTEKKHSQRDLFEMVQFYPHAKQKEILGGLKRFTTIAGGKRVGKTKLISFLALRELLQPHRVVWAVAPTYNNAQNIWNYVKFWADTVFNKPWLIANQNSQTIENSISKSIFELKTGENEQSLKGKRVDLMIIDEAPDIQDRTYEMYLRPNMTEKNPYTGELGRGILIGNPTGRRTWYGRMYQRGFRGEKDYASFHMPTAIVNEEGEVVGSNNPGIIPVKELVDLHKNSQWWIWKANYLAEFLEDEEGLFKHLDRIQGGVLEEPKEHHDYILGWDPAKMHDFDVKIVIDRNTYQVVYFERSQHIDYVVQRERACDIANKYNRASIIMDSTGVGQPVFDELIRVYPYAEDYYFSGRAREELFEKLSHFIQSARFKIPKTPELESFWDELAVFGFIRNGRVVYKSPESFHDDTVTALALAIWPLEDKPLPIVEKFGEDDWWIPYGESF